MNLGFYCIFCKFAIAFLLELETIHLRNNDIFRRLRYIFDFNDTKMMELFSLGDYAATRAEISDWLKKDDDPAFQELPDVRLAIFLNGFINDRRGKREGEQPPPELRLNNNIIFRKLRIALNLKDEDILRILAVAGLRISKHELSAFFRNPNQRQYCPCEDQVLRNFLAGLQIKHRGYKNLS